MSKRFKKQVKADSPRTPAAAPRTARRRKLAAALAVCVLLAAGVAATRYQPARRALGLSPLVAPAARQGGQGQLPLAKEYIYAGGRLVATEEPSAPPATPTPTPGGPAPGGLVATGVLPSVNTAEVRLTWAAPPGSPTSYVVERAETRENGEPKYQTLQQAATAAPTQANPYVDGGVAPGRVYLYRVKAVYAGGPSNPSRPDVAHTHRFTGDDPLVGANVPGRAASAVKAANLSELRVVIDAVRALAGLGPGAWKGDPAPLLYGKILAAHFTELRAQLRPALAALDIDPVPDDADITAQKRVKAVHVQDVRDRLR